MNKKLVAVGLATCLVLVVGACSIWLPGLDHRPSAIGTPVSAIVQPTPGPTSNLPAGPATAGRALQSEVQRVYEQTNAAVVHIDGEVAASPSSPGGRGIGSGFVWDDQGNIVTNYHVVADAQTLLVSFAGTMHHTAAIVGVDPSNDLAVIRTMRDNPPAPLALADSDELKIGQFVVAIGNPFGLDRTLSLGVISALGRTIASPDNRFIGEAIQTDAAINPGNSGGPLLDLDGRVVGVNTQILSESGSSAGIGFAIPANTLARVVPSLIANGRYDHPYLGVRLLPLDPEGADYFRKMGMDLPTDEGVIVFEVTPGSPADQAGLRGPTGPGEYDGLSLPIGWDLVTAINGQPMTSEEDLSVYLEMQTRIGQRIVVTVIRDGQRVEVPVTVGVRPESAVTP